jgi:hypothetical protein
MVAIRIAFADRFLLDDLTHENVGLALLAIALTIYPKAIARLQPKSKKIYSSTYTTNSFSVCQLRMDFPNFSNQKQERIYRRLNSLVSPGAAAFWRDACRLMEMEPPLEFKRNYRREKQSRRNFGECMGVRQHLLRAIRLHVRFGRATSQTFS